MLAVIVTITGRYICSVNIYCDNNVIVTIIVGDLYVVLTIIVMGRSSGGYICSANSYCDNNGEIYM